VVAMRKLLIFLILLGLFGLMVRGETNGDLDLFKGLQINYQVMSWVDYGFTVVALDRYEVREANPIARFYINSPEIAIPLKLGLNLAVYWTASSLYKSGKKFWAYSLIIFATIVQGFVLYNNTKDIS
jgi:hypothetical protein